MSRRGASALLFACAIALMAAAPGSTAGQLPDSLQAGGVQEPDTASQQEPQRGITPRGAFIRSLILPGWGHVKVGAFVRGGFYFAVEAATGLMVFKTQAGLSDARSRRQLREEVVTARLAREGITDPTAVESALADDPEVEDLRGLVDARSSQREDWLALGIFFLFLGGADAYVSAHLEHFPTPVEVGQGPDGRLQVGLSVPVRF